MLEEDLSIFMGVDGFAEFAIYNDQEITVIFDIEDSPILGAENQRITATIPSGTLKILGMKDGDLITIRGIDYEIKNIIYIQDGNFVDLELIEL